MSFKKILLSIFVLCFSISPFYTFSGVNVEMPSSPDDSYNYEEEEENSKKIKSSDSEDIWKNLIDQVNNYLWIILGVVAMGAVAYGGYILVSSEGDKEQLKKANKLLMFGMLGVLVAVSSYMIVKLVTGLF